MFLWTILMWAFFGATVFVTFYELYAKHVAIHPSGKTVVAVAIPNGRVPSRVVFGRNAKLSPAADELQEIADDILLLLQETDFLGNEIGNFLQDINADLSGGKRVQVPEPVARGHELYVGQVHVNNGYLHPSYDRHRTMVVAKSGSKKGKLTQLPWNNRESQKLFKGV